MPIHNILEHQDFKEIYQEQLNKVPEKYFDVYLL
jgi:predicted aldo/keto reductase-like oxidoreductase